MSTNLLALPLVSMSVYTGTNEDWVDSIEYLVDDGSGVTANFPQLPLTGISFNMEVRRQPPGVEVLFRASTDDGTLAIGEPPNVGFLLINVSHELMMRIQPGNYVGDIVGSDDLSTRRCVLFTLEIQEGVTRP